MTARNDISKDDSFISDKDDV